MLVLSKHVFYVPGYCIFWGVFFPGVVYRSTNKFHDSSRMCDRKLVRAPFYGYVRSFHSQVGFKYYDNIKLPVAEFVFHGKSFFWEKDLFSPPPTSCLRPINKYRFLLVDFCDSRRAPRFIDGATAGVTPGSCI